MGWFDLYRLAWGAVAAHRLRSALTMLGILIGIASVILLTSIGEGTRRFMIGEFAQFGTNILETIQLRIKNLETQVAHADFVDIGKGQQEGKSGVRFGDRMQLSTGVTARLFESMEKSSVRMVGDIVAVRKDREIFAIGSFRFGITGFEFQIGVTCCSIPVDEVSLRRPLHGRTVRVQATVNEDDNAIDPFLLGPLGDLLAHSIELSRERLRAPRQQRFATPTDKNAMARIPISRSGASKAK